jgi:hypothetical protein
MSAGASRRQGSPPLHHTTKPRTQARRPCSSTTHPTPSHARFTWARFARVLAFSLLFRLCAGVIPVVIASGLAGLAWSLVR